MLTAEGQSKLVCPFITQECTFACTHAYMQDLTCNGSPCWCSCSEASSSSSTPEAVPRRNIKVVANLPYNITKEFLKAMLPMGHIISELNIMIQDEVRSTAARLTARPCTTRQLARWHSCITLQLASS
jgi:hypothetical protein